MISSGVFGYIFDYILWGVLFVSLVIHTWCFLRFFSAGHRKLKLAMGNLLVFLCLAGLAAMAGETYLRFVAVSTDSFGMSLPARRWFAIHTQLNSLGCRDNEWTVTKPQGVRRIAFLGDSFSYGWGIENPADRFTDLLQARFNGRKPGTVQVLNVAKPGWGTGDQIQPLMDMIDVYEVDEVVLCHVPNDIEKLLPTGPDFNPIRPPSPQWINIESSPLLDYLYRRIYLPRVPTVRGYHNWLADGFDSSEIWGEHCHRLLLMIQHCRDRGVEFRVALFPFLRVQGTKFDTRRVHDQLRRFLESSNVPVLDLFPALAQVSASELVVNSVDAHPNEVAHRLMADAIWQAWYANH